MLFLIFVRSLPIDDDDEIARSTCVHADSDSAVIRSIEMVYSAANASEHF
jgi:hypothetical protein